MPFGDCNCGRRFDSSASMSRPLSFLRIDPTSTRINGVASQNIESRRRRKNHLSAQVTSVAPLRLFPLSRGPVPDFRSGTPLIRNVVGGNQQEYVE